MVWIKNITYLLYDILGIFFPGVLIITLVSAHIKKELIEKIFFFNFPSHRGVYFAIILFFYLYILGNILKIASQIFYDFLAAIFDGFALKIFNFNETSGDSDLEKFTKKYLKNIFSFKTEKYLKESEWMIQPIKDKIYQNKYLEKMKNEETNKNWYSLYELGNIYLKNKKICSLNYTFLSKYTLYRSLSFIFFINLFFFFLNKNYLASFQNYKFTTSFIFFISWLTFHIKYKKYYVLCGNEMLLALYYKLILEKEN